MKPIIYLLILFISTTISAQTIKGKITDSLTQKPMAYVNISLLNRDHGAYTNEKGNFTISVEKEDRRLLVSSIGYHNKFIDIQDFTKENSYTQNIILNRDIEQLNEVIVSTKKPKYTSIKTLGFSNNIRIRTSLPFGTEFANLIKNPYGKNGIIKTVILSLNKAKEYDYLTSYNIKFYDYDGDTKQPGALIYYENVIVHPENKTYKLRIDVEELQIPFLRNGVCVGVEIINTRYKGKLKSLAYMAPRINFTHNTKREVLTWSRRVHKEKWNTMVRVSPFNKKKYTNGRINLEVRMEK